MPERGTAYLEPDVAIGIYAEPKATPSSANTPIVAKAKPENQAKSLINEVPGLMHVQGNESANFRIFSH
jgi:hypothetical protein